MSYTCVHLEDTIHIEDIFSVHYFEYAANFSFAGETHDFWELVCVDKGNVDISMDERNFTLRKGEIAFHQPNEFHSVRTLADSTPNLVVISFSCHSPAMDFFRKKVLQTNEHERSLLADMLLEARRLFSTPLNDPYTRRLEMQPSVPAGSAQLFRLYLEQLLLMLLRRHTEAITRYTLPVNSDAVDIFDRVFEYMEVNLNTRLTVEQICRDNMIGRNTLQKIFQKKTGQGIIEYFSTLKIEEAKRLIRTGRYNFTMLSELLGYNSIHYFSRQFKKLTGMTPTEYASSIKAISERE